MDHRFAVRSGHFLVLAVGALGSLLAGGELRGEVDRASHEHAQQLFSEGNYQQALAESRQLLKQRDNPARMLIENFRQALACYQKLNQVDQIDDLREQIAEDYADDWQLLAAVAQSYVSQNHYGYLIAGEFRRGDHRGGGQRVSAVARDRVRALQLFGQAFALLEPMPQERRSERALQFMREYAKAFLSPHNYGQAWRLQTRTDLEELPDYEQDWGYWGGSNQGAPVMADGKPVFYELPSSWIEAENDGQCWRWLLEQTTLWQPSFRNEQRLQRARFLQSQFGVETLQQYRWLFARQAPAGDTNETGTYALHTLGEHETIARLATGIERFELPDEHNPTTLLKQVSQDDDATESEKQAATAKLAETFQNRRQYPRAADYFRGLAEEPGPENQHYRDQLKQIVGNWGRFEPVMSQPAGQGAMVDFRFRNGQRVELTAQRIKVPELLEDVKAYLKASPRKSEWDQVQLENLGHRLVTSGQKKYLGQEVARWSLNLEPLADHFDRRITVTTPLQEPGAYLLTSKMADGNSNSIVLWLSDTAIVRKPLQTASLYYVADATTGRPVPGCNVEFFGWWLEHLDGQQRQVHTKNFAELTDEQGLVELPAEENNRRYQWVAVATTPEGRFAYLGFRGVWWGDYHDQQYHQVKVFSITDRPVYRPEQPVQFKFWVRHAQYDLGDESLFAAKSFQVEIRDPKNEAVYSTQLTADAYGGLTGTWQIPAGAALGQYRINVVNHGGGSFRVEEYKKPEFEVLIEAPDKPVELGEKITAKISAKYYFGSPVTEATVKYKVLRTNHSQQWYPPMPWDWLYGPGYWWFARDYSWYPGWSRWGCTGPHPWWFWQAPTPPEVVAQRVVPIGPDGSIEVEIDTAIAKQFHPDQDHRYQIQAEVVDQSRRTIVGNGQVLVARQPFRVYVWADRGHYRVGDTLAIGCAARTLDGQPVEGSGTLRLLKIQYDQAEPVETEVGSWDLATTASGRAELQIKASQPGQYRVAYELTDDAGHALEGALVLTIAGEGFDGSEFRFNDLELVPDRREYQPGDKIALQINTNRTGAAVLLFERPANSVYLSPRLIELTGKSTVVELEVADRDVPNFFVEAVTVHGGRVHTVSRELFVPPVSRVLDVEVVPSAETYLPGQAAKLQIKLTDALGEPFVGSLAVAIYDKALEYIAGGTNVGDIREFFWKWRRNHRPQGETNLERLTGALVGRNQPAMRNLGIFGDTVVDEISSGVGGGGFGGGGYGEARNRKERALSGMALGRAPMAANAMASDSSVAEAEVDVESGAVQPAIRENFADTALWVGSLETSAEGIAEVELDMPENLTTWKVRVWGMGHGTRVGEGSSEVVTRKNVIVRLQAPRFFVERDEVVLSANVHNYLPEAKQVRVELALEGETLVGPDKAQQVVEIEAGGQQRVDWRVQVAREGTAVIRVSALTDEESDAMQTSFPVYVHGMLKTESFTGVIRPEKKQGQFTISVPAQRRAEQTRLEVRYTPTLAGAMVDALPYLIDYPYGCTEQTLNRFLPAVITQQALRRMDLDLTAIRDKRTNLNAQEVAPESGEDADRAKGWQRFDRNPVFDDAELDKIVKAGVNRLTEMQLQDGGWGWFSGWGERSSPHTTAVVVRGLLTAQENGVAVVPGMLQRGIGWLEQYQRQQLRLLDNWDDNPTEEDRRRPRKRYADNLDALVFLVLCESQQSELSNETTQSKATARMRDYLYRDRTQLAVYSLATLGLALERQGEKEMLAMVMKNLSQYVQQDDENQSAWLNLPGGQWWYWYGSEFEAHAYYLKLLSAVEPNSSVAPRLVKYLLNNRKHATYWNSTRDTALVVEAFADFLHASGEDDPEATVEIWIDGQQRLQESISRENLFSFNNKLVLGGDELAAGKHTIEIRKQGRSPIYFNGYLTSFTLEDDIGAAGLELKVARRYFKLTPVEKDIDVSGGRGQALRQQVEKYDRTPLENLAELVSGDLIEVELTVDSKNDYEYIVLEDMKAAGFEPVAVRSGYNGNELGAYVELRDDRVSLLVARLARGRHSVSYRLRAEIPGKFSALPTRASAMYAPELKANSDEIKLRIKDPQQSGDW